MDMIMVSGLLTATNADVLQGGRLTTMPSKGFVLIEALATTNDGTNGFTETVQLPDNSTPLNDTQIPAGTTAGSLDDREALRVQFAVDGGGHVTLGFTESGTSVLAYRVTFNTKPLI